MSTKTFVDVYNENLFGDDIEPYHPDPQADHRRGPAMRWWGASWPWPAISSSAPTMPSSGQPEINLGVIAGIGGTQRLTRFVGKSKSMEMHLTGRFMDAARPSARVWSAACARRPADPEVMAVARKIAEKSQIAVVAAKEAVNRAYETRCARGCCSSGTISRRCSRPRTKEGMAAFLENASSSATADFGLVFRPALYGPWSVTCAWAFWQESRPSISERCRGFCAIDIRRTNRTAPMANTPQSKNAPARSSAAPASTKPAARASAPSCARSRKPSLRARRRRCACPAGRRAGTDARRHQSASSTRIHCSARSRLAARVKGAGRRLSCGIYATIGRALKGALIHSALLFLNEFVRLTLRNHNDFNRLIAASKRHGIFRSLRQSDWSKREERLLAGLLLASFMLRSTSHLGTCPMGLARHRSSGRPRNRNDSG